MWININKIHPSFQDFFTEDRKQQIQEIESVVRVSNYAPKEEQVLRFAELDVQQIKVVILGQDPYPNLYNGQLAANGRAYQVSGLDSFDSSFKQVSLKNILRLIYKSLYDIHDYEQIPTYTVLRIYMKNGSFPIVKPKQWFDSLEKQGVLFLNSSLTVELNKPLSHSLLWRHITRELVQYICQKNPNVIFFIWGSASKSFLDVIHTKSFVSRHPMMCSSTFEDDFLKSTCFMETKDIIDWLGHV